MNDKAQIVRAADVIVVGPTMILGGFLLGGPIGLFLGLLGGATIFYNGRNLQRGLRE